MNSGAHFLFFMLYYLLYLYNYGSVSTGYFFRAIEVNCNGITCNYYAPRRNRTDRN